MILGRTAVKLHGRGSDDGRRFSSPTIRGSPGPREHLVYAVVRHSRHQNDQGPRPRAILEKVIIGTVAVSHRSLQRRTGKAATVASPHPVDNVTLFRRAYLNMGVLTGERVRGQTYGFRSIFLKEPNYALPKYSPP